jgi:hypothetical protein
MESGTLIFLKSESANKIEDSRVQDFMPKTNAIWKEFDALENELRNDIDIFYRATRRRRSQYARRAYCRAVASYFEAVISWMRRYTVLLYHPGQLADEERLILEKRLSATERAFHAIDLFTDTAGARTPLRRRSPEWKMLCRMVQLRNRILHPTCGEDILVSDVDLLNIDRAVGVIFYLIHESLGRCIRAYIKRLDEIGRVAEVKWPGLWRKGQI